MVKGLRIAIFIVYKIVCILLTPSFHSAFYRLNIPIKALEYRGMPASQADGMLCYLTCVWATTPTAKQHF